MPPEHMELWARRFGIKEGLSGSLSSSPGCLGDPVTAACFQTDSILDGKELRVLFRIGLGWLREAGLFFECSRGDKICGRRPAILPKLCSSCILCCFSL